MSNRCQLVINGRTVEARIGETLINAGLGGWIAIPHDCCSGQCDTCRVTVVSGMVNDEGTAEGRTVLACQATVAGNAAISFDEVETVGKRRGIVREITPLAPDILEVVVSLTTPLAYRPGQYVSLKFSGYPARDYSPTARMLRPTGEEELVFHIKRFPGGLVSTQLGATIRTGHPVQVRGPFGHAFLREGSGPLILIAGGTGWAPIWAIAHAARTTQRHRDLVVVAGVRHRASYYMRSAVEWLIDDGVREVTVTCSRETDASMMPGRPTHYLPSLGPEDTVYVAGALGLVDSVKTKARTAAARCYADPFLPSAKTSSLVDRVRRMLAKPDEQPVAAPRVPAPAFGFAGLLDRIGARREPRPAESIVRAHRQTERRTHKPSV